jgi:hypothetical protein
VSLADGQIVEAGRVRAARSADFHAVVVGGIVRQVSPDRPSAHECTIDKVMDPVQIVLERVPYVSTFFDVEMKMPTWPFRLTVLLRMIADWLNFVEDPFWPLSSTRLPSMRAFVLSPSYQNASHRVVVDEIVPEGNACGPGRSCVCRLLYEISLFSNVVPVMPYPS